MTNTAPNRCEPTTTDLAYAAGFFDGEGCVRLQKNHNGKYSLRVFVSQKDTRPLVWLQRRFGGRIGRYSSNVASTLYLMGHEGCIFLQAVVPLLIVKKAQAELAIRAYQEGMTAEIAAELTRMKKELV